MPRPQLPPHLVPRQPKTVLGSSTQKLRLVNGWTAKRTAEACGCSPSHSDGLLLSLYEVVEHAREQTRRRGREQDE